MYWSANSILCGKYFVNKIILQLNQSSIINVIGFSQLSRDECCSVGHVIFGFEKVLGS